MRVRLEIGPEATQRLVASALAERRPLAWQAEVLLLRALGLPDGRRLPAEPGTAAGPREPAAADRPSAVTP
jgi:hypothetical protein